MIVYVLYFISLLKILVAALFWQGRLALCTAVLVHLHGYESKPNSDLTSHCTFFRDCVGVLARNITW